MTESIERFERLDFALKVGEAANVNIVLSPDDLRWLLEKFNYLLSIVQEGYFDNGNMGCLLCGAQAYMVKEDYFLEHKADCLCNTLVNS